MKLVKVKVVPKLVPGPPGPQGSTGPSGPAGRDGRDGKPGEVRTVREEKVLDLGEYQKEVAALKKQFDWLKKRNPEVIQGGGQAVTKYIFTNNQETHFMKPSFVEGVNIIGVRYSGAATVYLPHDLDPTMIVSIKDESGSGNITILVE